MIPALKKLSNVSIDGCDVSEATYNGSKNSSLGKA